MSLRAGEFYQTMKAYVRTAMEALAEACPKVPPVKLVGLDEWVRTSGNAFVMRDREQPYWEECILRNRDRLHSLGQYQRLVDALKADGGRTMLELIAADQHEWLLNDVRESFDWAATA